MQQDDAGNKFDRAQFLSQATSWLLEMELISNDYMKNALILNLYKVSDHIKDVQVLADQNDRKMLVFLELSSFGRMFKKRQISQDVLDMLQAALPSFQFRVIFDKSLFEKAIRLAERKLGLVRKPKEEPKKEGSETPEPETKTEEKPT